jgi:hypothetical protein
MPGDSEFLRRRLAAKPCSDMGNAERFAALFPAIADRLRRRRLPRPTRAAPKSCNGR